MTPCRSGRITSMVPGARPSIALAWTPTARTERSRAWTATMEGSLSTTPYPGTYTRVLAVPRSTARSRGKSWASVRCSTARIRQPLCHGQDQPEMPEVAGKREESERAPGRSYTAGCNIYTEEGRFAHEALDRVPERRVSRRARRGGAPRARHRADRLRSHRRLRPRGD